MATKTSVRRFAASAIAALAALGACASAPEEPRAEPAPQQAPAEVASEAPPEEPPPTEPPTGRSPTLEPAELGPDESAAAPTGPSPPGEDADAWRISLFPYLWIPALDGSKGDRDGIPSGSTSGSLADTVDFLESSLDRLFMGHAEVGKGGSALFANYETVQFSGDGESDRNGRGLAVDYDLDFTLAELGFATTVAGIEGGGERQGVLEILAGARWSESDLSADARSGARGVGGDRTEEWLDAFVGARATLSVAEWLSLGLRADVGGFGLGESSDVAWNFEAALDAEVVDGLSVVAGWRAYTFERTSHGIETDITLSGPFLGIVVRF